MNGVSFEVHAEWAMRLSSMPHSPGNAWEQQTPVGWAGFWCVFCLSYPKSRACTALSKHGEPI